MAIKKLQNNFTTPEQSKRLLELGVPVWTADGIQTYRGIRALEEPQYNNPSPCWSVGRLMEIYDICRCYDGDWDEVYRKETYVSAIEEELLDDIFDFSKLEE